MSLAITYPGINLACDRDYEPASRDSGYLQSAWDKQRNYLGGTALDWLPSIDATLRSIQDDCGRADWDGEGAHAVTNVAIARAEKITKQLFAMLPKGVPVPDIVPESDGEIGIGWTVDARRTFALSIGSHDKINFAGQFGTEGEVHGWKKIDVASDERLEESLEDLARQIVRLYPEVAGRSSLRRVA